MPKRKARWSPKPEVEILNLFTDFLNAKGIKKAKELLELMRAEIFLKEKTNPKA